ncbi:MAG: Gfo/Idh/MocA family oxidoreductase [Candidatus Omnitrophica bacterium]|nr:Gfo/Idh/MocA family oxidoreductase [Candidatus Omnitrophota bacterium]MDE2027314.1 Gfo/Idh/MocA family oxidoreductase [Candidatus Omnitrophota bacterium]MDE2223239.1 Gfo/Idh/MocA family oxidoreductase [Candidatus Omnitrophota bacterium]
MKIIFFGLGSIGSRHARLLRRYFPQHDLYALRSRRGDKDNTVQGVTELKGWEQVDEVRPQAAFITNPTALHIPTAIECAKRKMALFIEKPISDSLGGLEELLRVVENYDLVTYVAYVLRFHPVIVKLKELLAQYPPRVMHVQAASFLPTWRPGRDHREIYSARQELGGGVLLDLSHEVDYVQYLLGPVRKVKACVERRGKVTVDTDDSADLLIEAAQGFANVHLSYLSHWPQRRIVVYSDAATLVGDFNAGTITIYAEGQDPQRIDMPIEKDELFRRQLAYFLEHSQDTRMMNNIHEAKAVFESLLEMRRQDGA